MKNKTIKEKIDIGVGLVTIIGTIMGAIVTPIGLIYTFYQYKSEGLTARQKATLDLYQMQLENPLLNNRASLDVFYNSNFRKQYLEAIKESDDFTALENFTNEFSKGKSEHILALTSFYEGVVNCVQKNVCDKDTTRDLFAKDIKEFVVVFGPFFCKLRQELRDDKIVANLEEFYKPKNELCSKNNSDTVAERGEVFQK